MANVSHISLQTYVGGQMEIQKNSPLQISRGEIEKIELDAKSMRVRFRWLATQNRGKWVKTDTLEWERSSACLSFGDAKQSRIMIQVAGNEEIAILFPPDGSRLDPKRVEGLVL